jgi:uncharacterized metal-binding protein YceD (DUF177 family)
MQPPPTVSVDTIPEEGTSLALALDSAWLSQVFADAAMRPVEGSRASAKLRLDRDGADVIVSGTVKARVAADCVACLEPVELPVETEFQLVLSPAAKAPARRPGEEVELSAGELDADFYTDGQVDLAHWLREQLLLEAPVHPRHEGDCPRALLTNPTTPAPNGGAERAVDPRLAPLLKFRKTP